MFIKFPSYSSQGHTVPRNYNPADFYIKTLAVIPAQREECIEKVYVKTFKIFFKKFSFLLYKIEFLRKFAMSLKKLKFDKE